MRILAWYLTAINLLLLIMMGADKIRAKQHRWRISERMLFVIAALGGSLGGLLGMLIFRHKTKHLVFEIGFPLLLVLHIVILLLLIHFNVLRF